MMKVLVVDGDHTKRQAILAVLGRVVGITVQGAIPDYATAAHVLQTYRPDILITGTELIDGNALQLVEWLGQDAVRPSILVIGRAADEARYRDAGVDHYITLNGHLDVLCDAVVDVARRRKRGVRS
jgi:DNA-binding NarL/FixJ family response regulator